MITNYKQLELSTQIIIKEALKRNIDVEILDEDDNFIRLKKGGRVEYIKQATKTSADTYIVALIMENKELTKLILKEHDINVPSGITLIHIDEALSKYPDLISKDIVI